MKFGRSASIISTSEKALATSRASEWWKHKGFMHLYQHFRKGPSNDGMDIFDHAQSTAEIAAALKLRNITFGNYVSNNDRYNYLAMLCVGSVDLMNIVNIPQFGFGKLAMKFGAAGVPRSLAHFRPSDVSINLNRFKRGHQIGGDGDGMASLAHEYAHFLDQLFGHQVELKQNSFALTFRGKGNGSTSANMDELKEWAKGYPMRTAMAELMASIILKPDGSKSEYWQRISTTKNSSYYKLHHEIFARTFEQWIHYKLQNNDVNNRGLTKYKYLDRVYLTDAEFRRALPKMNRLAEIISRTTGGGKRSAKVASK